MEKLKKSLILSSLLILIILLPLAVRAEDESTGNFSFDDVNDPPTFQEWYETEEVISPFTDVLFFAEIQDIDNSSDQLNVSLHYTFTSSWGASNETIYLNESTELGNMTYRFEYLFSGQASGAYMQYYYQVFDGETTVREGYPIYFDLQWSLPAIIVERPLADDVEYEKPPIIEERLLMFLFFFGFAAMLLFFFFAAKKSKNRPTMPYDY